MYIYVHIYIHIYICVYITYIYIYTCIHVCIYVYTYMCKHVCICICIYIYIYTHLHTCYTYIYLSTYAHISKYVRYKHVCNVIIVCLIQIQLCVMYVVLIWKNRQRAIIDTLSTIIDIMFSISQLKHISETCCITLGIGPFFHVTHYRTTCHVTPIINYVANSYVQHLFIFDAIWSFKFDCFSFVIQFGARILWAREGEIKMITDD